MDRYTGTRRGASSLQAYFLYFIWYAVIGWLYEVFLETVIYRWGFTNRGVLFGPWCPIYGVGALVFLLCFRRLMDRVGPSWFRWARPVLLFLGCMAVATAIELFASYLLEWTTGAWPWQTYADYAVNFQGRVALSPSIRFGLGGVVFLYVLQPLFERMVGRLPDRTRGICSMAVLAAFLFDCAATLVLR